MSDLVKRDDDTVETIRERFRVYDEQTEPLLAYFAGRGMLTHFNVTKGIAETDQLYSEMVQQEDI
jgi:adenylate kinase